MEKVHVTKRSLPPSLDAVQAAATEVAELIETIQDDLPADGCRRITHELHRRSHWINRSGIRLRTD